MEHEDIRELTAAYAVDALDPDDARAVEEHLRHCEDCRRELAELRDAAASLAYAAPPAAPPPRLRERVVEAARRERGDLVPLRPRWAVPAAAAAAVAACAALGLGLWAASLHGRLDQREQALHAQARAVAIVGEPGARRIPLSQGTGALVVAPACDAALVVSGLPEPPSGKTYEIWVIEAGTPKPAGLFSAHGAGSVVALDRAVPDGATVAVTVEAEGGVAQPTGTPVVTGKA